MDMVTRAEAIKMIIRVKWYLPSNDNQWIGDIDNIWDLAWYINAAAQRWIIAKDSKFLPNDYITRWDTFKFAAKANGFINQ
jgi:hypothetical protein